MSTIVRAGDCATQERLLFTGAAITVLNPANYAPTTGIAKGQWARAALINLETNDIRYHLASGAVATDSCGMIFVKGDYLLLDSPQQMMNFNGITTAAATTATAVVFYYF